MLLVHSLIINKGTGGHGNKRTNGDNPNYYIVEIGQNTEKSPGIEKTMKPERDSDTKWNRCTRYSHQRFGTRTRRLGSWRTSGDNPNYYIVEIGQNTEKSPGDLRRLAVSQTPMKNHQLTLVGKILNNWIMIMIKIIINKIIKYDLKKL